MGVHIRVVVAAGSLRQGDAKFKARMDYIMRPYIDTYTHMRGEGEQERQRQRNRQRDCKCTVSLKSIRNVSKEKISRHWIDFQEQN